MLVTDYLEKSALSFPDKIAVITEDNCYSYNRLLNDSLSIAQALINAGSINKPVIVFMDKGYLTLCAFMAIAYSRCFYSLINPDFPSYRIMQIKNVINTDVIITDKENLKKCQELFDYRNIYLVEDLLNTKFNKEDIMNLKNDRLDIDPVYCNFTSGSTGNPKGVLISNQNIIDFIENFNDTFGFNHSDIFANQAPWDFDVSTKDIYTALKNGATLLIIPRRLFSNPMGLVDYLKKNKPTIMIWAVSALCLMSTFHLVCKDNLGYVKKVLFSGEVMPLKHLNLWLNTLDDTQFVNLYGPTEITCNCTYYLLTKKNYDKTLPIGKAFKNEEVFLLDDNYNLIKKENKVGEIYVRGSCVGLGYYNNEIETKKSFIQNPLHNNYIDIVYKTNDLAYYDENKNLVFQGRKDFQIKHLGHRIELEEIECNINKIAGVNRAVVIFLSEKSKLIGFYDGSIGEIEILKELQNVLPRYMIPSKIIKLASFPLNKNGKIDRKLLKEAYLV